jgi:predicted Zn-dependent protease
MSHAFRTSILAVACLVACASASAFDFGNLKDMDRLKKAIDIGGKAVKAKKDIPQEEEIRIGDELAAKLLGAAPLVDNTALQQYVNRVGYWLALQSERADLPWRFGVIESDDVNAFSMPGGTVLITRGMYARFRNEGELAGVLAHEIGHVVERHQLRQIQKAAGNEWKADLIGAVADEKGNKDAKNIAKALTAGIEVFTRGLDKQDEFAADRSGVVLAARAGYNPYGLVGVLQTLGDINAEDSKVALMFQTHPSPLNRQDMLADAMGESLDAYAGGVESTKRFVALPAK